MKTKDEERKVIEENIIRTEESFECKLCGHSSELKAYVRKHMETHIVGLTFPCDLCEEVFPSRNTVNYHTRLHKMGRINETERKIRNTSENNLIEIDEGSHDSSLKASRSIQKKYQVNNNSEGEKLIMENLRKRSDGNWQCEICSYSYIAKSSVVKHLEQHIVGMKFDCKLCPEYFPHRNALSYHCVRVHK